MTRSPSDALVVFGMTGDLAHKMIFPALYAMVKHGNLKVPVIGVALPKWSDARLHRRVTDSIERSGGIDDQQALRHLLSQFRYVSGDYEDLNTFAAIKKALDPARRPAHYLAIPPSLFETAIKGLSQPATAVIQFFLSRVCSSWQFLDAWITVLFAADVTVILLAGLE